MRNLNLHKCLENFLELRVMCMANNGKKGSCYQDIKNILRTPIAGFKISKCMKVTFISCFAYLLTLL